MLRRLGVSTMDSAAAWNRGWRWCTGVLLAAALAAPAQAQTGYRIEAAGCGAPTVASTTELFVTHLGEGVGANGGSLFCASSIGADTGVMSASTAIDWSSGSVGNLEFRSTASLTERIWIDGLKAGETAWIEASLALTAAATVSGAPGSARGYGVLNVAGCRITRTVFSNGTVSDNPNCSWAVAGGDAAGIFVSVPITTDLIGPSPLGNYVALSTTVGALVTSLFVPGVALADSVGQLRVSKSSDGGATFRFANAATLTAVPEPSGAALGAAALAALAVCRRRGQSAAG
jgi:hypothetical protein